MPRHPHQLARRRTAAIVLGAALLAGGGALAPLGTEPGSLTALAADDAAVPAQKPAASLGAVAEAGGSASQANVSASGYLTKNLSKVQARHRLSVYADAELTEPTGKTFAKNQKVTVKRVVDSADGVPALRVAGGYISAASADVRRPAVAQPKAQAVYAVDVETGEVLYERGARQATAVASLVKIMTALILRDEIAAGNLTWDTTVKVTSKALVKMSKSWDAGGTPLKLNRRYTLRDLDTLALLESHNAAVTQLGWFIAGSNEAYLDRLAAKAAELGMNDSTFMSISGLDNKTLDDFGLEVTGGANGNRISAADLGTAASALVTQYPDVLETTSQLKAKVGKATITNTNQMLEGKKYYVPWLGVDGLKTGYTSSAGWCFIGTAQPEGRHRIVFVVVHAPTSADRFSGAKALVKSLYDAYTLAG
jgi:D-alanyl-D-alanine carboxypeptidase (penicillin-binding protein 5/6)